jgi:hypothetical protein
MIYEIQFDSEIIQSDRDYGISILLLRTKQYAQAFNINLLDRRSWGQRTLESRFTLRVGPRQWGSTTIHNPPPSGDPQSLSTHGRGIDKRR